MRITLSGILRGRIYLYASCGRFCSDKKRVIISLAPSDKKKGGSHWKGSKRQLDKRGAL